MIPMFSTETLQSLGGLNRVLLDTNPEIFSELAAHPDRIKGQMDAMGEYLETLKEISSSLVTRLSESQTELVSKHAQVLHDVLDKTAQNTNPNSFQEYLVDFAQRSILFLDILRQRGNMFIHHETEGCPPVLVYEYDVIVDGTKLEQPVNYSLVHIHPPKGITVQKEIRPYIIIDPRAGHGSGIGGFKNESEVGVALEHGHPVYFVIFTPHPVPGQTLADVCRAEAHFVREVIHLHPHAPKPVVVGNCQGGWAAMLLAATNPDLTGPVVLNGSPMSYWSGERGKTPMRYAGGVLGGVWPAMMMADLGNGEFDGACLVNNFEKMNPANTYWKKNYEVFSNADSEADRYLEFERWWSGFYFMNENEIRWIVENLFVGNKLARGGVNLDRRLHVDLRNVRAPVIVFASHGDNITPPPQALNWICDTYSSVREIKARGQRIIYTVHDSIGHLGIFVSSSVAKKQHEQITSTLGFIEALSPGLYEMKIVDVAGEGVNRHFEVAFEEREIEDILGLDDNRKDEKILDAAARVSEINSRLYELTARPVIQAMSNKQTAKALFNSNSLRAERFAMSDKNPAIAAVAPIAETVRANRRKAAPDNPYLGIEHAVSDLIVDGWNIYRDIRDGMVEAWSFFFYGSPILQRLVGSSMEDQITHLSPAQELLEVPDVRLALEHIDLGGYVDGVIRMLILLARSRKSVRKDRLERSNQVLNETEPFASLSDTARNRIVHRQTIIVEFEPVRALSTLPSLLPHADDRQLALQTCHYIAGSVDDMDPDVKEMFMNFFKVLDVPFGSVPNSAPDHAHHHAVDHEGLPIEKGHPLKKPTASATMEGASVAPSKSTPERAPKTTVAKAAAKQPTAGTTKKVQ